MLRLLHARGRNGARWSWDERRVRLHDLRSGVEERGESTCGFKDAKIVRSSCPRVIKYDIRASSARSMFAFSFQLEGGSLRFGSRP